MGIEDACVVVTDRISNDMKDILEQPFTREEILSAIHHTHLLKALGLDGFPALFYQKYWGIIGEEMLNMVLNILNNEGVVTCKSGKALLIVESSDLTLMVVYLQSLQCLSQQGCNAGNI